MKKTAKLLFIVFVMAGSIMLINSQTVLAETTDTPETLVASGVTTYTHAEPKLFWHTGVPACPPTLNAPDQPVASNETIKRIASYGSEVRTLYSVLRDCDDGEILSNIIADDDYVYWLGPVGMMRLSTDANPGDEPEIMNALVDAPGELAMADDRIYAIETNTGGSNTKISYVLKSNKARVYVTTPGGTTSDLQTAGNYVYYRVGSSLYRVEPGVDTGVLLSTDVTGYYPEGPRVVICGINPIQFCTIDYVFIGKSDKAYRYDNETETLLITPIYTSVDTSAVIYDMVSDSANLFITERRTTNCAPLCVYSNVLLRTGRFGGTPDPLHTFGPTAGNGLKNLRTNGSFLFWNEAGALVHLPNDAAALPQVNLTVTGIEVTQGIQDLNNSVLLVKERRTFVRVYVQSAGTSVSGVGAQLYATSLGLGPLKPINPVGTQITVQSSPNRNNIDHAFLFELPWFWTNEDSLTLKAVVNPYKVPLEPDYNDNNDSVTVNFNPSPTLNVEFFRLNYNLNNTTYRPRINQDIVKTYSWLLRAYPIGGAVGEYFKPRIWDVDGGTVLGSLVDTSHPVCALIYNDPDDDIQLCASYITNGWLASYRIDTIFGFLDVGLNPGAFFYGMISDASNNFPRGQAMYTLTSVGPAGVPGQFFNLGSGWDTDGSYADWYAAHEIGHTLGRAHPNAGSDNPNTDDVRENCGHSRSDPYYPYGNTVTAAAPIGPANNSVAGFDSGDPGFGIPMAVLPSSTWNDMMSYCNNQWISDYTYEGIYNYMNAHLTAAESQPTIEVGDFLVANGIINDDQAVFSLLKRLYEVNEIPPSTPDGYRLQMLGAGDLLLAEHAFSPQPISETDQLSFELIVDFEIGTQKVQVVRNSDNQVLASEAVSANPPMVSNVSLGGIVEPVNEPVTLNWSASDSDGDDLTFDIAYSIDNGVNFQPVAASVMGNSIEVDTSQLPGSANGVFRVIAYDGFNNGFADSPAFEMAAKPPQPMILLPGDPTQVHWGQLVNFSGMALDPLDGTVAGSGLVWKDDQGVILGTGALLSLDNLPVGTNVITLEATNSDGQSASTTVTVIVDDDLTLPGPTLGVGPLQVSWQVNAGSTSQVMAEISIGNAGSGSLDWTASENAPWLTLSATNGSIAAGEDADTLTLTANPSGLEDGQSYSTLLTITKPAAGETPEQTVTLPVTISVGDVWMQPTLNYELFLPIIIQQ